MGRIFGVGLPNAVALFFFFVLMIIVFKVILAKYPVKGLTEIAHAI